MQEASHIKQVLEIERVSSSKEAMYIGIPPIIEFIAKFKTMRDRMEANKWVRHNTTKSIVTYIKGFEILQPTKVQWDLACKTIFK